MDNEKATREELRRRLRNKIREKKNPTSNAFAKKMKDDPKSTLLSLGIDNADILNNAQSLLKNPEATMQKLKEAMKNVQATPTESDDDEELPPE